MKKHFPTVQQRHNGAQSGYRENGPHTDPFGDTDFSAGTWCSPVSYMSSLRILCAHPTHQAPNNTHAAAAHTSSFSGEKIRIQANLQLKIGRESVASRKGFGGGGSVHYLPSFEAINLSNKVFGFCNWTCK